MESDYNDPLRKYKEEIAELYEKYVNEFIQIHYKYGKDNCFDAYSEAVLTIYESLKTRKTRKGNPFEIKKDLKNLLFVTAKRKLLTLLKKKHGKRTLEDDYIRELKLEIGESTVVELDELESNHNIEKIKKALPKIGANCQEILQLFYLEGYDIQEIREIKKYKDEAVVKQSLYRCREKLRKMSA